MQHHHAPAARAARHARTSTRLLLATAAALLAGPAASLAPPALTAHAAGPALFGIYPGKAGSHQGAAGSIDLTQVPAVDAWLGESTPVVNFYSSLAVAVIDGVDAEQVFSKTLPTIWADHAVPLITLDPGLNATSEAVLTDGTYDAELDQYAQALRDFLAGPDGIYGNGDDRRAYMRFAWEMNGDWFDWMPAWSDKGLAQPTPAQLAAREENFQAMWAHVWTRIMRHNDIDNTHLAWVYSVSAGDSCVKNALHPEQTYCPRIMEAMYPGDAYVDWVGIDGYNNSSAGPSAAAVFGPMVSRLRALTSKPLSINEVGTPTVSGCPDTTVPDATPPPICGSNVATLAQKDQWITDFFSYVQTIGAGMALWFNIDKEQDWAVFSLPDWAGRGDATFTYQAQQFNAYSAFKTAVTGAGYTGADPSNPRLISDATFLGATPTAIGSVTFADDANDFSQMSAHTASLTIDSSNPQYFNGDTGRVKRSTTADDGTLGRPIENVQWHTPHATHFHAQTWFWAGAPLPHFTVLASPDGSGFTALSATGTTVSTGVWDEVDLDVTPPAGTNWIEMQFPDVTPKWNGQIGQVTATLAATPYTDDLYGFDDVYQRTLNLTVDSSNPQYFGGDSARIKRSATADDGSNGTPVESLTWQLDGMSQATLRTWFSTAYPLAHFTFEASADGQTFAAVQATETNRGGSPWTELDETIALPPGTRYLRATFPDVAPQSNGQLGQAMLSNSGGIW